MGIPPEPKDSNNRYLELLKELMGEDGLTFLNRDNAIASVKQAKPVWQAPFAIGLYVLPFLYHPFWEKDSQDTGIPTLALLVLELSGETYPRGGGMTVLDLVGPALEPLEALYNSLQAKDSKRQLTDELAHTLFHTCFALGVLLLVKGDEERASPILRRMADTKTTRRGPTFSSEGLNHWDVEVTKTMAAIILQDFYARRQDYDIALYLLTEAVASNGPEKSLLAVVPGLLESFAEKCERVNNFEEWVDLFDRAAGITEICGEADVSGDLPSVCKPASPQFLSWKFGQLVARFAIRNGLGRGDSEQVLPLLPIPRDYQSDGTVVAPVTWECGNGWGNGTVVASLLCEYDEHRNWRILRQQYVSMWESSSRYQWLSLCEVGTETDLYWAMRMGFADQMLSTTEQTAAISVQTKTTDIIRDIEMTKDITSTIALHQMRGEIIQQEVLELVQKLIERQPPTIEEIIASLEQQLCSVWHELPSDVMDKLSEAEQAYKSRTRLRFATIGFAQAVETCFCYYFVNLFADYLREEGLGEVTLVMGPKKKDEKTIRVTGLNYLSLGQWSGLFETLVDPSQKETTNLQVKMFMKQRWPKLVVDNLKGLVQPLKEVQRYRNNAAHPGLSKPPKEEKNDLEDMRNLVLGIDGPSVITQIFQLFTKSSPNKSCSA